MIISNAHEEPTRSEHMSVRWDVFVLEQHVPMTLEIDARDYNPAVTHLCALTDDGHGIGAVRIIPDEPGHYHLGRLAVRREYRGQGLGRVLVEAVHHEVSKQTPQGQNATVILDAQIQARGFYEAMGYHATSERTFYDAGIEHIEMAIVLPGEANG